MWFLSWSDILFGKVLEIFTDIDKIGLIHLMNDN
jgi:hypothetical protein